MTDPARQKFSDLAKLKETLLGKELLDLIDGLADANFKRLLAACEKSDDPRVLAAYAMFRQDGLIVRRLRDIEESGRSTGIPAPDARPVRKQFHDYDSPF